MATILMLALGQHYAILSRALCHEYVLQFSFVLMTTYMGIVNYTIFSPPPPNIRSHADFTGHYHNGQVLYGHAHIGQVQNGHITKCLWLKWPWFKTSMLIMATVVGHIFRLKTCLRTAVSGIY